MYFILDEKSTDACNSCCCQSVSGQPGEIDRWTLDLANWAVPIGGKGISEIVANVELLHSPTPTGPQASNGSATTPFNTIASIDLKQFVDDAGDEPKFRIIPFYGPKHGKIGLDPATGIVLYTPTNGWTGYDKFYFEVSSGNKKSVAQIIIGTQPQTGALPAQPPFTPHVEVPDDRIDLNRQAFVANVAVIISPAAVIGEIYRITVKVTTLDCDCNPFINLSCYDLTIGKC